MKYFIKTNICLFIFILCLHYVSIATHATSYDPGAGRLSGRNIPEDFYGNTTKNSLIENEFNTDSLIMYGSRKIKSPYTGAKYTHQTIFDNRTILHGIDVSKWQGEIDWAKVKADGIDYAFIQVGFRGYGDSGILSDATKDPYFDINMQNAIANGIQVGVYVFSQATTKAEALEEANYILDAIHNYSVTMPLVMDFEYASTDSGLGGRLYKAKLSKQEATDICMAFCTEVAAAGYTPMVYANKSMLEDQLYASTITDAGYRIWLANYTQNTNYSGSFDFWQYSEKGSVDGINGDVDMNFYYAQENDDFSPKPNSISLASFTEVPDFMYTGNTITPTIMVSHNETTLIPNVDYTISYSNNKQVGTATITIQGIGNYCDTRKIRFNILPNPVQSFKAKKRSTNAITLSWKKDSSISGYEIYRADKLNGTFKLVKTITKKGTTTWKNTGLSAGKCYYYQVRSYKKVDGKSFYSDFSPITTIYTKTGYTRNALTKKRAPLYDCIPGTKTITESVSETTTNTVKVASTTLATIKKNKSLSVIYSVRYKKQTWYYVKYKTGGATKKGYINSKDVTITKLGKIVKTKQVNVRKKSTVYSKKITTLKKNKKVNILSTKKKHGVTWYKVRFEKNGKTYNGWISAPYIKII